MDFCLFKKRLKLKKVVSNKNGISPLLYILIGSIVSSFVLQASTMWWLNFNKGVETYKEKATSSTLFYNEGNKIKSFDYTKLRDLAGNTIEENAQGYTIKRTYSKEGVFADGKCNTAVSENELRLASQRCIEAELNITNSNGDSEYKMKFTRHSTQMSSAPKGTITVFNGDISEIPEGWAICDGTNGTPDLTDKFIQGTTKQSEIGHIAGQNFYNLDKANLPSSTLTIDTGDITIVDSGTGADGHTVPVPATAGVARPYRMCQYGGPVSSGQSLILMMNHINIRINSETWKGETIVTQPPYMKLYYIMRVK